MAARFREGNVTVELDDRLERLARATADRLAPGLLQRLEGRVRRIFGFAKREWPVRTGRSRAGLDVRTTFGNDEVAVEIINTVDYAVFVRPKKLFSATTAWQRWVRGPMAKLAREEVDRLIADEIREALGG